MACRSVTRPRLIYPSTKARPTTFVPGYAGRRSRPSQKSTLGVTASTESSQPDFRGRCLPGHQEHGCLILNSLGLSWEDLVVFDLVIRVRCQHLVTQVQQQPRVRDIETLEPRILISNVVPHIVGVWRDVAIFRPLLQVCGSGSKKPFDSASKHSYSMPALRCSFRTQAAICPTCSGVNPSCGGMSPYCQ